MSACGAAQGGTSKVRADTSTHVAREQRPCADANSTPAGVRHSAESTDLNQQEPTCKPQETPSSVAEQGLQYQVRNTSSCC